MRFDTNHTDQADAVFEFDGLKVFVDKASLLYMDGVEVDYVELLNDAGFKFTNPNATGSCGCGSSFQRVNLEDTMAEIVRVGAKKHIAPGSSASVDVRGQKVAVFNIDGTFYAVAIPALIEVVLCPKAKLTARP